MKDAIVMVSILAVGAFFLNQQKKDEQAKIAAQTSLPSPFGSQGLTTPASYF